MTEKELQEKENAKIRKVCLAEEILPGLTSSSSEIYHPFTLLKTTTGIMGNVLYSYIPGDFAIRPWPAAVTKPVGIY